MFADYCVRLARVESAHQRLLMPVQLFLAGLEVETGRSGLAVFATAGAAIRDNVLSLTRGESVPAASFNVAAAAFQFAAFASARRAEGELGAVVLRWLLESQFDDRFRSARPCREICRETGVTAALALGLQGHAPAAVGLGFGELIDGSELIVLRGR